jgi:glycosyltransferase involved in cell wall biosynthesis
MRIAFAGNQNNYPFMLARALRRAGHDVRFVVDRPEPLNRPEGRYPDIETPYPDWIVETDPVAIDDVAFCTPRWTRLLSLLAGADALVLNSWMYAAGLDLVKPSVCLATGSDLDFYANPKAVSRYVWNQERAPRSRDWRARLWNLDALTLDSCLDVAASLPAPAFRAWRALVFRRFVERQRAGLRHARAMTCLPAGTVAVADRLVRELRGDDRPLNLLMTDTDSLRPEPLPANARLRLFNSARLDWAPPLPPMVAEWENKRGDILLQGVALYHARTGLDVDLHLVAKGQSVEATRALAATLGIDRMITWHAEMTQQDVRAQYRQADVVVDQLGHHLPGMSTYDAMAMGRPVLANGRADVMTAAYGAPLPIADACTPEGVADRLQRLSLLPERRELSVAARAYAERHLSADGAARRVIDAIAPAFRAKEAA